MTEIAGYRVIRELGAGGMGQVFLVEHPRLPRRDALKLLDSGVSRNHDFKARFQREADLLAQLSHPNVVTLHDRGEFDGRLWITMEFIDGTDAAELLEANGPLEPNLALSLVSGAGTALDYAWRKQRITHRDVKPANILVGIEMTDGTPQIESVKLADFGIAKAAGESTSLTSTGMTIGTMQYISPEAIEGEEVDNRSDIYSLGCTAFHLFTGQPPFSGTSIASTMSAHLTKPVPSISTVNQHLPQAMDAVFTKVLAKKPNDRYQSCAEFSSALQAASTEEMHSASAPTTSAAAWARRAVVAPSASTMARKQQPKATPHPKSRALPITAAAVAVVAATATGVYITAGGTDAPTTPAASPVMTPTTAPATNSVIEPPSLAQVATATPEISVTDVDPDDFLYGQSPNNYRWAFSQSPLRECGVFEQGTGATLALTCEVTFPPGTPPVTDGFFSGPPNEIKIAPPTGPENMITEGGLPANKTLLPNHRITVGGISCTALGDGGIDCSAPTGGFRFENGVLTKRSAEAAPTVSTVTSTRAVVTTTAAVTPPVYEGKPCSVAEFNQESADGTLYCSAETGAWRDMTHQNRPAIQRGAPCTEPGARARVAQTDGIATCKADPNGNLVWAF